MEFRMKKNISALMAAAACLVSGVVSAQTNVDGPYVGGQINHVSLSADGSSVSDNFMGIYGGYRAGNYAGEISYSQKTVDGAKASFTDFALVPHFAMTPEFDLLGKVALRHSSISGGTSSYSGNSLVLGVGVEYKLTAKVAARAMIDYSSKTFGESMSATTLGAGVHYKF
jgi:opacity protein-like surface antigen